MTSKEHWEKIYTTRAVAEVSWFQKHAALSLKLITQSAISKSASVIDVGGGASTLVDDMLAKGYSHLTVLDLSPTALASARSRLGARADEVQWIEAGILEADLPVHGYDLWHDRAVFHFLTVEAERRAYVDQVLRSVKPGGFVIVATFSEDGPNRCSGLPTMRYSASELHAELGESFELLDHERETHHTPGGNEQRFVYCFFRKTGS